MAEDNPSTSPRSLLRSPSQGLASLTGWLWPAPGRLGGWLAGRGRALVTGWTRDRWRRMAGHELHLLGVLAVALIGSSIGAALAPPTTTQVGPLTVDVRVVPSLHPGVSVLLPPAGKVDFLTDRAPVSVEAQISEVDLEAARVLIGSPAALTTLERTAPDQLRSATLQAAVTTFGCALLGAVLLSVLVYRRRARRTAQVAASLVAVMMLTTITAVATFDPDKFAQPRFTGLLTQAPYVANQASSLVERLKSYRSGLAVLLRGVTALYATASGLPVLTDPGTQNVIAILHVSDIHLNPLAFDLIQRLVDQFKVSVVVDTGDITVWGTEVETQTLSRVGQLKVPYVYVRGNHDSKLTQAAVASARNAVVLDDGVKVVDGVVFAGIGDPRFTPDQSQNLKFPGPGALPSVPASPTGPSGSPSSSPTGSSSTSTAGPTLNQMPTVPQQPSTSPTGGAAAAGSSGPAAASPTESLPGQGASANDPEVRAGQRLAGTIQQWDSTHPRQLVNIAMMHNPVGVGPMMGTAPLILTGHLHRRVNWVDQTSGTRVMVEGSTGGAGLTGAGVSELADGAPVPLNASIIYLARSGPRAGQVLAYDQVTVGGFGLASVSLERTVVRPDSALPQPWLRYAQPAATAGTAATPSPSPRPSRSR